MRSEGRNHDHGVNSFLITWFKKRIAKSQHSSIHPLFIDHLSIYKLPLMCHLLCYVLKNGEEGSTLKCREECVSCVQASDGLLQHEIS